ncbi:TIGR03089 family protein, partial [Mycolicibacterium holsaticum]|uniref:TIGR03089 family protein n=1 Tax=Mycolicibacterium holsaticum TaxID=152142 RepID=UPI000DA10F94
MSTVSSAILDPLMAADPAGPRITYYDDATGERIELSTATLANWAAKTGNLLRDELGAGPGSRVAVLLPAHWQTAAVLFGIWWIGAEVVLGHGDADVALCTEDRLSDADAAVGSRGRCAAGLRRRRHQHHAGRCGCGVRADRRNYALPGLLRRPDR